MLIGKDNLFSAARKVSLMQMCLKSGAVDKYILHYLDKNLFFGELYSAARKTAQRHAPWAPWLLPRYAQIKKPGSLLPGESAEQMLCEHVQAELLGQVFQRGDARDGVAVLVQ